MIRTEQTEVATFYYAEARGISYCARANSEGGWEVHSARKALGRTNVGSFRRFDSAMHVAQNVKAFRTLPLTLQMQA